MKKFFNVFLVLLLIFSFVSIAFANETKTEEQAVSGKAQGNNVWYFVYTVLGASIAISVAALGGGIGQGIATAKAVEGIARQPEASGKIQTLLILGLAFIESLTIYALVIALILIFVNPFAKFFIG